MVARLPGGTRGRLVSAGVVVVGLAAVYGIGTVTSPATVGSSIQLGHETRVSVSSAIRACAAPGSSGATASSVATAAIPGKSAAGSASISRLTAGTTTTSAPLRTLATPGVLTLSPVSAAAPVPASAPHAGASSGGTASPAASPSASSSAPASNSAAGPAPAVATTPGRGGVVVQATGAMAQGLEVEQAGSGGLVTAQCPAPGTDFWFVGPGQAAASQVELYLMNTDSQAADAEVDALTDSGPLLGSSDTGIIVPPHSMVAQSLGTYLHGSHALSLHVTTSVGRVAVAVRQSTGGTTPSPVFGAAAAPDPGGWLPATQPPATSLTIPGLPGTPGTVTLYLAVPGTANAQVKVTAVTAKGTYQPTGGSGIDLPGDSAVATQIASLSGVPAAIRITSNVPVTASAVISGGAAGSAGAISAAAVPVVEQGVAAANPAGSAGSTELVISAPGRAAAVRITTGTAKISLAGQAGTTVTVPAGHTVVTPVSPPSGGGSGPFSVVVTPEAGSGPVYVGRVIRSGGIIRTIMPLTSALTWVQLPPVQDSLNALGSGS